MLQPCFLGVGSASIGSASIVGVGCEVNKSV